MASRSTRQSRGQGSGDDVVRITTAPPSHGADVRTREKRYLISMAVRTVCFVGAIVVGPGWLRWVLILGAVFLPYVAVVMANAQPSRGDEDDLPAAFSDRPELRPPS